jgi:hypothetical protein
MQQQQQPRGDPSPLEGSSTAPAPKPWHRATDATRRASTTLLVKALLRSRFPEKSDTCLMATTRQFERYIYMNADSLEEYACQNTLKRRLFVYALIMRKGNACCAACGGDTAPLHPPAPGQAPPAPATAARVCVAGASCCGAGRDQGELRREQQGRILLMRHLSRCAAGQEGETAAGRAMKESWKHISDCRSPGCAAPDCLSTRRVVRHYTACLHAACPLCAPVKAAIRAQLAQAARSSALASAACGGESALRPSVCVGLPPGASVAYAGRKSIAMAVMPRRRSYHSLPSCASTPAGTANANADADASAPFSATGTNGKRRREQEGDTDTDSSCPRTKQARALGAVTALGGMDGWKSLSHISERLALKNYICYINRAVVTEGEEDSDDESEEGQ